MRARQVNCGKVSAKTRRIKYLACEKWQSEAFGLVKMNLGKSGLSKIGIVRV